MTSPASASAKASSHFSKWRRVLIFSGALLLLVLLFYAEEDWRGKRAWELCKRDLSAQGQLLDPQSFIPPPVPDDQNVLKAPKMADWFGGNFYAGVPAQSDLSARLSARRGPTTILFAQFTVRPPGTNATKVPVNTSAPPTDKVDTNDLDTVDFKSVPLTVAINSLAAQLGLNVMFDPPLFQTSPPPGILAAHPMVTRHWRNTTAAQALSELLGSNGLVLVFDPATRVVRVKAIDPAAARLPPPRAATQSGISVGSTGADLELEYNSPVKLTPLRSNGPGAEIVSAVSFDGVSLTDAIQTLATQAGRTLQFDPALTQNGSPNGPLASNPVITDNWKNISADQALFALLNNFGMVLVEDPVTHASRVTAIDSTAARSAAQHFARRPDVHAAVMALLRNALGFSVVSPLGYVVAQHPLDQIKPVHIVFRSSSSLTAAEIESFIKEFLPPNLVSFSGIVVTVDPADPTVFQARLPVESAVDFLAWSDKLEPDFDLIRQALQRPQAQRDDYQYSLLRQSLPNFITVRTVAQALAERAQCHLLLGQPDMALRDLTLIHDLPRAFVTRPLTFIQAMITVAVGGLYTQMVADGLRLRAWREPELAALEDQLRSINWPPLLSEALATERASDCQRIERMTPAGFGESLTNLFGGQGSAYKPVNPLFRFLPSRWIYPQNHWLTDRIFGAIPRGWRYQNMVMVARLKQELMNSIDLSNRLILPEKAKLYARDADLELEERSPFTFLSSLFAANTSRSVLVTAHNQTAANQARVACALERYRLALGQYPDSLEALVPRFLEKLPPDLIGGQSLKYRRDPGGTFLLYSIGWNEKDDGGISGQGNSYMTDGDWVWQQNSP